MKTRNLRKFRIAGPLKLPRRNERESNIPKKSLRKLRRILVNLWVLQSHRNAFSIRSRNRHVRDVRNIYHTRRVSVARLPKSLDRSLNASCITRTVNSLISALVVCYWSSLLFVNDLIVIVSQVIDRIRRIEPISPTSAHPVYISLVLNTEAAARTCSGPASWDTRGIVDAGESRSSD